MEVANRFEAADRIADRITGILKDEIEDANARPVQILAGQLLALFGYMSSAPDDMPVSFQLVKLAVKICLDDISNRKEQ